MARGHKVGASALCALALLLPATALAELPPAVSQAQKKVTSALSRFESAKDGLENTRSDAEALEHRIAALKRLRAKGATAGDAELASLLRESVASDASLREGTKAVEARDADVRRAVVEAFAAIDARIKELKPRLYQGELESRRTIARNIEELLSLRKELGRVITRLRATSSVPGQWSQYQVKIDPLDGPQELGEKADFVDDTRDRFQKKLEQLRALIKDAREEQDLSHAASAFQTDTRIFDEEDRSGGRVSKNRPTTDTRSGGGDETLQQPNSPAPQDPAQEPANGFAESPADIADGPADKGTIRGDGSQSAIQPPSSAVTTGGGSETSLSSKQIDPNMLLNLRVESLAGGAADLSTLEAWARDLERLDGFLKARANELRKRGKQLEADEAKALGN